jgi:DNA-binding transcriptional LysR family regulator
MSWADMDIEQLVAFVRVVREGSFTRAAWVLHLSQPSISMRIQGLEAFLGGPVFVRGGRGVTLTDLGRDFLPYAQRALEVLEAGSEAVQQTRRGSRGRVAIGVLESLSGNFLGPALTQFHSEHPQVDVLVRAGRHEQLIELLRDGVISLALLAWPCAETLIDELEPLLLLREPVVLVAGPNHPLAQNERLAMEELSAAVGPFLTMRWWVNTPTALEGLAQRIKPVLDVPLDTGRTMVLSGAGVGFFPWVLVADLLQKGQLRQIHITDMPSLMRDSALVRRARAAPLPAAAHHFITILRERSAQLSIENRE